MPKRPPSGDARSYLARTIHDQGRKVSIGERQQNRVINDPSHATGDPANGYAVWVEGWLGDICNIPAYGVAAYMNGNWWQVSGDTGWKSLVLSNSWTGTLSYRVIGNELRINGSISGGTVGAACATLPPAAAPAGDGGYVPVIQHSGASYALSVLDIVGSGGSVGQIIPLVYTATWTIQINGVSLLIN